MRSPHYDRTPPPQVLLYLLFAVLVLASARPQSYDSYEDAKYDFSWSVDEEDYNNNQLKYGHKEERDGHYTSGQYYVLLPDTRLMRVEYYADETGFHPSYTFEGTAVYPEDEGYSFG